MTTEVFEYYSMAEYDNEVNRILTIDQPRYAAFFYHAISKVIYGLGEETVSEVGYAALCDYLLDKFGELPADLSATLNTSDLEKYTCSLVERGVGETFKPGVHFLDSADYYLRELEDSMLTDFKLEIWEPNASTD